MEEHSPNWGDESPSMHPGRAGLVLSLASLALVSLGMFFKPG
jgi:hypothetical protein